MAQQQVCTLPQQTGRQPDLTLEVISDPEDFLKRREQWDQLIANSEGAHPYMSHAWLSAWWDCFGGDSELRVFVVKSAGEWMAAAPMMIRRTTMYRVPIRRLEAWYNHHTPRCEFPVRDPRPEVYRLLWDAMSAPHSGWDAVLLQQFGERSHTLATLQRFAEEDGWLTGRWAGPASPFIRLACSYDELFNRLRPREKSNLKKRFAKLSKLGSLQLEIVTSPAEIADAMQDGLRIEGAAWKEEAGTAIVSDPRVRRFYTLFADQAAHSGFLRLAFLKLDNVRIAFFYLLDFGGMLYALKVGYAPDYHTYSPGHLLLMLVLKQACDENKLQFDFQGNSERWKLVWTTETRRYPWLFMFRDNWRSRLLHRAKFVVLPKAREILASSKNRQPSR